MTTPGPELPPHAPPSRSARPAPMPLRERLLAAGRRLLPERARHALVRWRRRLRLQWPPVGAVRFGSLRRLTPISPFFALDRGQPIERYYIERFLDAHRGDIRGRALEFGDTTYLQRFGSCRVTRMDVFSYVASPGATLVGDLTAATPPLRDAFDCIVCTQTLQMIYQPPQALRNLAAMLAPGGVLLLTTHGISRIGRYLERDAWGEYWHLTRAAAERLFAENFGGAFTVTGYGNVLTAVAALHGLAADELEPTELDYSDRDFDVIIGVRAARRAPST